MHYDAMIAALTKQLPFVEDNAETVLAACVQAVSEVAGQEVVDMQAQLPQ